jgi:uncharacterized protein YpmB
LGGIFVFYFLTAKASSRGVSFCYLPNCRVLKDIRSKPFYYSDEALQVLTEKDVDTADVKKTLTYGDVDFGLSNVSEKGGKLYVIYGKNKKNEKITVEVINYTDKVLLKNIRK